MGCGENKTRTLPPDAGQAAEDSGFPGDASIPFDAGLDNDSGIDAGPVDDDAGIDAGPMDVDAGTDAGTVGGTDAGTPDDGGSEAGFDAGACMRPPETYTCDPSDAATCPGGTCIPGANWCVGQVVDAGWYASCGNGVCDPCETATECPVDCAPAPTVTGTKVYTDPDTIDIWVHGFTNHSQSQLSTTVYGAVTGCNDLGTALATFKPSIPCATGENDLRPNQAVGMEYYGAIPPDWMTQAQINEVEQYPYVGGPTGLQRYGLILGMFIKWRLQVTGAHYANLVCHSMGCLLSRYVIENDIEQLASTSKITRWETNAGVLAGARLARLYDNPQVQMYADVLGLSTDDFALMNPAYVQQYAAVYDHQLYEGNNPLFNGILIHHMGANKASLPQAAGISLLDGIPNENPGNEPNDGIMFTSDEYFRSQSAAASVNTPDAGPVASTHVFDYIDHIDQPSSEEAKAMMVAALYNQRKVVVTLKSLTLNMDFENDELLETGVPPAEVVAEVVADYSPYTLPKYGVSAVIDNDTIAYRTATMYQQTLSTTVMPNQVVFEAPVFDDQTDFNLNVKLTETDYYTTTPWNVNEVNPLVGNLNDKVIVSYSGNVSLMNQTIPATSTGGDMELQVQMIDMY